MFGKGGRQLTLLGFTVRVDASWLDNADLITWSLASGLFPARYPRLDASTYWVMGAVGALGLFLSVVIHEFSHSLVARARGMKMRGITLFIFGGVAEMEDEPPNAKTEFEMAIIGPITSLVLGGIFYALYAAARGAGAPVSVEAILAYLAIINVLLAVFNLVPAFPLDGGRVFRAALWGWKNDLRWATRIASGVGNAFGILLIAGGIWLFITGHVIDGVWYFLIGSFLRNAAMMSYRQVLLRQALEGESLRQFMEPNPITAPPDITVAQLVRDFVYRHHFKMFPVVENGRLEGCVSTAEIKAIPREEWDNRTVRSILSTCSTQNTVTPDTDPMKALAKMSRNSLSRLLVVQGDRLEGVITLKDMMRFLASKMDLEGVGEEDAPALKSPSA
jgi:Zn-dependent protease/predicted transcriptional regulator